MPILQEVEKSFNSIGFDPKLKPFNHKTLSILVILFPGIILQLIFLIHVANSAEEYMESLYIITVSAGAFLSFATTILITEKLFYLIEIDNEYVRERMGNKTSKAILEKTNEFVEKYSKIGMLFMKYGVLQSFILPKATISFIIYFTTDLGNDAFDLPVPMWLPYDWKTPVGYLMTIFIQFFWAIYLIQHIGCLTILAFGIFMFAIAFVKIMKNDLHKITKSAKNEEYQNNMYKKLSDFIWTHANAKQMTIAYSDFLDITLTIVFTGCIITICVTMLLVQIELSHSGIDSIVLLEAAVFGACSALLLLFACELGQRFTNAIGDINDVINQFEWYLFPEKIQRMLPTVMQSAQQPTTIKCFGNVLCARGQFKIVVKTVYSYFMTLREFYE